MSDSFRIAVASVDRRELAAAFEVPESTVIRWAAGHAAPHPKIQEQVIVWVHARVILGRS